MTPPAAATCPQCHLPLPPSAPRGLCPACLMDAAVGDADTLPAADAFGAPLDLAALRRAFRQLEILAPLGAGGMGRVYKVKQPHLDRIVALKVVPPEYTRDPAWVERFTREARALARLNHPNIVQVYDFGQTAEAPGSPPLCWLLMEYVDGVSLRQVQRTGGLSSREALALIPKLCDALQYAHEKGVLHRDIKPENILLDAAGTVKIADFGLAKLGGTAESPALTLTGARLGTAAYMAPEQIESPADVDHRADIYSLGVVFYELLTGGLPLGRFPAPSEKSGTDPRLDHIVFRTLEKERDRRYQAAGEVRTALDTVAASPQPPPLPQTTPPGTPQAWDFHRVPTPTGVEAMKIKPEPRIIQTKHPLPSDAPPDLPPGKTVRVTHHERRRNFASGTEAAGYGCGWLLAAPIPLALASAPGFLPAIWSQLWNEQWRLQPKEYFTAGCVIVAAITGLLAWLAPRPFLRLSRLAEAEGVKKRAFLLLAFAMVIWGGALAWVSSMARSFPNVGEQRTLDFSFERPALRVGSGGIADENQLALLWQQSLRSAFAEHPSAILAAGPGTSSASVYQSNPLYLYYQAAVAGQNPEVLSARLAQAAGMMMDALPQKVRPTVQFSVRRNSPETTCVMRLRSDAVTAITGILMTLGGWLVSLTRLRKVFNAAVPWTLGALTITAFVIPDHLLSAQIVRPRTHTLPPDDYPAQFQKALESADAESPEGLAYRWMDACRRQDFAAAQELIAGRLEDTDWARSVGHWRELKLLHMKREPPEVPKHEASITLLVSLLNTEPSRWGSFYFSTPLDKNVHGDSVSTAHLRLNFVREDNKLKLVLPAY